MNGERIKIDGIFRVQHHPGYQKPYCVVRYLYGDRVPISGPPGIRFEPKVIRDVVMRKRDVVRWASRDTAQGFADKLNAKKQGKA